MTRRQEQHAHAIGSCIGQSDSHVAAGSSQKSMRHLQQNTGPITGARVGRDSASVREILEKLERFPDYIARTDAMDVRDESDSARVVFVGRVI